MTHLIIILEEDDPAAAAAEEADIELDIDIDIELEAEAADPLMVIPAPPAAAPEVAFIMSEVTVWVTEPIETPPTLAVEFKQSVEEPAWIWKKGRDSARVR